MENIADNVNLTYAIDKDNYFINITGLYDLVGKDDLKV